MSTSSEVVIVGGGVIGLSIAYALAREGVGSTVLDRGPLGRAASWAGAGILAPGSPGPPSDPESALRTLSARLHAEWSQSLREETGLDNGYRACGGLDLAYDPAEEAELEASALLWRAEGIPFERLDPPALRTLEPGLDPRVRAAYHLPGRAQIRNPWHLRALIAACHRRGVRLMPHRPATGFETTHGRILAVRTFEGALPCGLLVVAAGPWSGELLEGLGLDAPTPPVRGQMVLMRTEKPALSRIVERGSRYLVPRDDGRLLVGSTEELVGFDARTTSWGVRGLIDLALTICPALGSAEIERAWAGLRPGSRDGRPYLGRAPGWDNLILASGHKRVGLQLSTGTAAVVSDLILGHGCRIDLTGFASDREPRPIDAAFRS